MRDLKKQFEIERLLWFQATCKDSNDIHPNKVVKNGEYINFDGIKVCVPKELQDFEEFKRINKEK